MKVYVCYEVNGTELVLTNGFPVENMRVFQTAQKAAEWLKERVKTGIEKEEFTPENYDAEAVTADIMNGETADVTMKQGDEYEYDIIVTSKEVE